jgi:hypothetical protein
MNPGQTLAPPTTVTLLALEENIFVDVIFVVVTSVRCFLQVVKGSVLVGAGLAVVVFAFNVSREVVAVAVMTTVVLEAVVAKVRYFVVEVVVVGAGLVIVDGAFGWTVTDDNSFVLDTSFFYITVLHVVALFEEDVVCRNISYEFFPSWVEFVAFVVLVDAVAEEAVTCVGFFNDVAVFILYREVTVDRLSCFIVVVISNEREVCVVELNPVRTVFKSSRQFILPSVR